MFKFINKCIDSLVEITMGGSSDKITLNTILSNIESEYEPLKRKQCKHPISMSIHDGLLLMRNADNCVDIKKENDKMDDNMKKEIRELIKEVLIEHATSKEYTQGLEQENDKLRNRVRILENYIKKANDFLKVHHPDKVIITPPYQK